MIKFIKEEKQLLLKDLCARLPYNVKVKVSEVSYPVEFDIQMLAEIKNNNWYEYPIPYLRPMSSMTYGEKLKYYEWLIIAKDNVSCIVDIIDWLTANHFDYRGLIPKGRAIQAPEGMYK